MTAPDVIGNTLRRFYALYGLSDEGPPKDLNVSELLRSYVIPDHDIKLLERLCDDEIAKQKFFNCHNLLEGIADALSASTKLLDDLSDIIANTNFDMDYLSNGIIWFTQASLLDPRRPDSPSDLLKLDLDVPHYWKVYQQVLSSLVFRLYIALVYMREGSIDMILKAGVEAQKESIARCRKLFNSDYVRHLRNALSHGHFYPTVAGLYFRDGDFETVATPGFLDKLCLWIFLIHHQCITVFAKHIGARDAK